MTLTANTPPVAIAPQAPPSALSRPRRLRQSAHLRAMASETRLLPHQLMTPYFVVPGAKRRLPISAMPGIEQLSVDELVRQVGSDLRLGLRQVLLFGVPEAADKDLSGAHAARPDSVVVRAVAELRQHFGAELVIGTDVCLCAYTTHGHCGVLGPEGVDNDRSLPYLSAMAVAHAQAGADLVAPSDMMDERIGFLRRDLDAHGLQRALIMAYAVKYASGYYGPFRDAAASSPGSGDRKGYQMDCRNAREALREVALDEAQGADLIMVKPGLAYLDIVARVRAQTPLPLCCYNVSGEYSMVKAAAARGWLDEAVVVRENLYAMARAGADVIVTYHGRDALRGGWLDLA